MFKHAGQNVIDADGDGVIALWEAGAADQHDREYVLGEMIVSLHVPEAGKQRREVLAALDAAEGTLPGTVIHRFSLRSGERTVLVKLSPQLSVTKAISQTKALKGSGIVYAEPNHIVWADETVPNDPDFDLLWGMHNTGQNGGTADADIDAPEAWDSFTGSTDVIVAVIDSGVDYDHPDLSSNIWTNPGESGGGKETNGIDDDANGYIDDVHGYDFALYDPDPMDANGHGTHVAGTIAAVGNNGMGVVGVSWTSSIMCLRFLGANGSGSSFDAAAALDYAVDMGARVTNNSWGGGGFNQTMLDAITAARDAGVIFVAAAGNSTSDNDTDPHYPSSYGADSVVAVASTDRNDALSSFSNWGATSVDLAAPGSNIYSTVPPFMYLFNEDFQTITPPSVGPQLTTSGVNSYWGTVDKGLGDIALRGDAAQSYPYQSNSDGIVLTPVFDTTGLPGLSLSFWYRYEMEDAVDALVVEVWDGSAWHEIFRRSSSCCYQNAFYDTAIDLEPFRNTAMQVRFQWLTDGATNNYFGAELDNISIRYVGTEYDAAGYGYKSGTSMASPHVAGAAGLFLAADPGLSLAELKAKIIQSDWLPSLHGLVVSNGRLNLAQTGPVGPYIIVDPDNLANTTPTAQDAPSQNFTICSSGDPVSFTITDDAAWLECIPSSGVAGPDGSCADITVAYSTSALVDGVYDATLTVESLDALNSPAAIPVTLAVGSEQLEEYALPFDATYISRIDADGDGDEDLLLALRGAGVELQVLENGRPSGTESITSSGSYHSARGYVDPTGVYCVAAHDGGVDIFARTGSSWVLSQTVGLAYAAIRVVPVDIDLDGDMDIAVGVEGAMPSGSGVGLLLLHNKSGTYTSTIVQDDFSYYSSFSTIVGDVAVADVSGDSFPDIVISAKGGSSAYITWQMLSVDGTTFTGERWTGSGWRALRVGLLNGDQYPDLAATGPAVVDVAFGDGTHIPFDTGWWTRVFEFLDNYDFGYGLDIVDWKGDGSPDDIIVGGVSRDVVLLSNDGTATFLDDVLATTDDRIEHVVATREDGYKWVAASTLNGVMLWVTDSCEVPLEPTNPLPADEATDVSIGSDLEWNTAAVAELPSESPFGAARNDTERSRIAQIEASEPGQIQSGLPTVGRYPASAFESRTAATVEILAFNGYSDNSPGGEYENTLNAIAEHFINFNVTPTITEDPSAFALELVGKDVLLVPEQEYWNSSSMAGFGAALQSVLNGFVDAGGIVIACDHISPEGGAQFMTAAGLMAAGATILSTEDNAVVTVVHPLTAGVSSPFVANDGAVRYASISGATAVVTHESTGDPMVAVNETGSGAAVLIGFDYFSYNTDMARIIANAVQLPTLAGCPTMYDVYFGTDPGALSLTCTDVDVTACDPGLFDRCSTYYWQVCAKNRAGETCGPVWSFTTEGCCPAPPTATNPGPADGAEDVPVNADLSWSTPGGSYQEDFEDGIAQGWEEDIDTDWTLVGGRYVAAPAVSPGERMSMVSTYGGQTFGDFYVQAEIEGDTDLATYLLLRATADFEEKPVGVGSAYLFGFDDLSYSLWKMVDGFLTNIVTWTTSPHLTAGKNTLGVLAVGDQLTLYINGQEVNSVIDNSLSSGRVGLLGYADLPSNVHYFDNILVTDPLLPRTEGVSELQAWYNAHPIGGDSDVSPSGASAVAPPDGIRLANASGMLPTRDDYRQERTQSSNVPTAHRQSPVRSFQPKGSLSLANVAIFQDQSPWGQTSNETILMANSISFVIYGSADMGLVDLSSFNKVIISSVQPSSFYDALEANRVWFEDYAIAGGIIDLHLASYSGVVLNGKLMPGGYLVSVQPGFDDVAIVDADHAVLTNPHLISESELDGWNYSTHGYFASFPASAHEIIEISGSGEPCAMDSVYGAGRIFATVQPVEWDFASSNYLENTILHDLGGGTGGCPRTYDVYFGTDPGTMTLICADADFPACDPGVLETGTTYYWQVITKNSAGATPGPVWSFTTSADCDGDGTSDAQEILACEGDPACEDCNGNDIPDGCDIDSGSSLDCQSNGIPDDCETDCNGNFVPDDCDISDLTSADCNANAVPDECDITDGTSDDCQPNGIPDLCEIGGQPGALIAWGDNTYAQNDVPAGTFASASGGRVHSVGLHADGTLAAWGWDSHGQLVVPAGTHTAVSAGGYHNLAIRTDGTLAAWGNNDFGETDVPAGTFTAIAAGYIHSLAIRSDGTLEGWGHNTFGQSDVPAGAFIAVAAGENHSLAVRADGTLAAWGHNGSGQCNVPAGTYIQVAAGSAHSVATRSDGTLAAWGRCGEGQCDVPAGTFVSVAAGRGHHTLAIRTDGTVAGWGLNTYGQTSVPSGVFASIGAGETHSLAVGTSVQDCNGNSVPDECDPDADGDGVPDACDICPGGDDTIDCQPNGTPDACDISGGSSLDDNTNGIPDECECPAPAPVELEATVADMGSGSRMRCLSFSGGTPGASEAVRVQFDIGNGLETMWVQTPFRISEASGSSGSAEPAFWSASLSCFPQFTDWTQYDSVHVQAESVIPGNAYDVSLVKSGCEGSAEGFSVPLTINTSSWGDMVSVCVGGSCGPPSGAADFDDISAVVDKFRNLPGAAKKSRADVAPGVLDFMVDFTDIPAVVDGFRGLPYPYTVPSGCGAAMRASGLGANTLYAEPLPILALPTSIRMILGSDSVRPGELFEVDIYAEGTLDLRTYQLTLDVRPLRTGFADVVGLRIDQERVDHAFVGLDAIMAVDQDAFRMGASLFSGGTTSDSPQYLGTFVIHLSDDASGTLSLSVGGDGTTFLRDSYNEQLPYESDDAAMAIVSETRSRERSSRVKN